MRSGKGHGPEMRVERRGSGLMKTWFVDRVRVDAGEPNGSDAPGILIADGGVGVRTGLQRPRVVAFVYGENLPALPTLPFGRWKLQS